MADHDPGAPVTEEVADGVYAYIQPDGTWWINNTSFLTGPRSTLAIDTCSTERRTRALLDAIAARSPAPVTTLVNTHHHGDHTHGNFLLDRATVVGHHRTREEVLAAGPPGPLLDAIWDTPDWGDIEVSPPTITFEDSLTVWVGDLACRVAHVGTAAHTTNDSVVWIPDRGVLFCGDLLFNGGTPFVLMGSLQGAIAAVESLRSYGAAVIVPGHGPPCGPEVIDRTLAYLRFVAGVAADAQASGVAPLEAARSVDLGEFAGWSDRERIVGNLHRAMAELGGAGRGSPLDLAGALTDMVAYNGGHRLHCHA